MNPLVTAMSQVRGAVYVPARAYNTYQFWRDYDVAVIARDFGYARRLRLNALRLWVSYERWLEAPAEVERNAEHLLTTAAANGLRVMAVLFEQCGIEPTPRSMADRDPLTAFCLRSPHADVVNDPARWDEPRRFVRWFMDRFGATDERLLAVEPMNEPKSLRDHQFARAMMAVANERRGRVPLTVGSLVFEDSRFYQDLGLDILQAHENFHRSADALHARLRRFVETQEILGRPVMVTEWQRLRPGGTGWDDQPVVGDEWQPAYATMAPILRAYPIGTFLWSLMLKPAYLPAQRPKGTLNGVFHEDGAVWSLADARAIADDPALQATERPDWPDWAVAIPRSLGGAKRGGFE